MLADEHTFLERIRPRPPPPRDKSERRSVRTERVVGNAGTCDEIRPLIFHARIDVLTVIAEWPAVEATVHDRGHVIGNEVTAKLVALVYGCPQRTTSRLPRHAIRIAQP